MLPVSGAVQFMAILQSGKAPKISAMGAYSNTLSFPTSGKKKLYKPLAFAFCLSSIWMGGTAAHTGWRAYCGSSPGLDSRDVCTFFDFLAVLLPVGIRHGYDIF